jgi:alkylation response protein AidB-like acyl-CoA dehydrogenase
MMLASVRDYVAAALPISRQMQMDHDDECPEALIRSICGDQLGVHLLFIPEEHGGLGGNALDIYRLCEQLARLDIGLATSITATFLGSDPIAVGGTAQQRARWLGEIAEKGVLFAYGATEPEAGSDLGALRTTARPVLENGRVTEYRLTGRKQWISNGGIADRYTVLALAPGGPSWFVVERDTPGFERGRPEDKHGIRLSNTAALILDDVPVPADQLVGGVEGRGLIQAQQVFGYTRLNVASFGLGGGWAALDRAVEYSTGRIQAGGPLSTKQGYTHKLIVPHAIRLEAARASIEETCAKADETDTARGTEGAIAKYLATEAGNMAADAAIQAHGGYGYTRDYLVEKIRRDVRITTIYEGTSEIMEMTVARDRWREHLQSAGRLYPGVAAELRALHARSEAVGADVAAIAADALGAVLEACRLGRLTRHQHILLRLGELIAYTEGAASLARRAAQAADGTLPAKADHRFDAATLAAMSRVYARDVATKVSVDGLRWVAGAPGAEDVASTLATALDPRHVRQAQTGLIADMDAVAAAVYGKPA